MTNETTINKLIEMRLSVLADAYRTQLSDHSMQELSFEDRFGLLVDIEYNARKDDKGKLLIKRATFDQPQTNLHDINYTSGRKLNKSFIERLAWKPANTTFQQNIFVFQNYSQNWLLLEERESYLDRKSKPRADLGSRACTS